MTTDDTIRVDFEFDDKQARRDADSFIDKLEADFKKAQKALSKALADGVGDAKAAENVKQLAKEVDKAERELKQFKRTVTQTGQEVDKTGGIAGKASASFSKFSLSFSKIAAIAGAIGLVAVAQQFTQLAGEAFQATARLEQTENALNALVARELVQRGDFDNLTEAIDAAAPRAEELLVFIRELAKASPFGREQIQQAFQTALAYGFTTDEAERLVTATVDLAAATGQGAESAGRIALALGQIQAKGKVSAEELNQLREAGFDANGALADLGFTLDDVTKGLVSADDFIQAAVVSIERDFGGAAAAATDSLSGLASTLGDLRSDALVAFFRPAFDILKPELVDFVSGVEESIPKIEELGVTAGETFASIANALPEVNTLLAIFNKSLELTGDFAEGVSAVSGSTSDDLRDAVRLAQEGVEAQERINQLLERRQELGLDSAASIVGREFDDVIVEEIRQASIELIRSAENVEEAQAILVDAFGDELAPFSDSVEQLFEESQRFSGALKEGAEEAANQRNEINRLAARSEILATATDDVSNTFELSGIQATEARQVFAELGDESLTLAGDLDAATVASNALNSALGARGRGISDIIEGRQTTGGGGGGVPRADVEKERIESIAEIQRDANEETEELRQDAIEQTAEIQEGLQEDIAEVREGLEEDIATVREKAEADIAEIRKDGIDEIAQKEADLDKERIERLREFNAERSKAFLEQADAIRAADEAEEDRPAQTAEEQAREVLGLAAAGGADVGRISEEAVEAGVLTAEQAAAALEETLREQGGQAIADALASDELVGTVSEAIAELNRQIAAGETLDLTSLGVQLETAAQIEADIESQKAAERRRVAEETAQAVAKITQDATAETAKLQQDAATQTAKIQQDAAEKSAEIQIAAAEKAAEIQKKTADDIAKSNDRATKAIARGQKTGGGAVENTTESLAQQLAQQLINEAQNTKDLQQKREIFNLALEELTNVGLLTQAEADRELVLFELQSTADALAVTQGDVNTAFKDGETTLKNNQQTVDLLKSGYFDTATQAKAFATVLREDQIPAFVAALEKGVPLRDILADMGVKISELPDSVQLTINTNAPAALTELEKFEQKFKELDGQEVNTKVNVELDERAAAGGGTGSTGAGPQAPGDAFMQGGYTGNAPVNQVAGVVHGRELVVPDRVLKGGVDDVVRFALSEVPAYRNNSNAFPAPAQSFGASVALPSQVTNISNATSGDTITTNGGDTQTVNLFGNQAAMVARGVFEMEGRRRDASLMRRGDRITQL